MPKMFLSVTFFAMLLAAGCGGGSGSSAVPVMVVEEIHTAAVGGSFALDRTNVNLNSISVKVKDPGTEDLVILPKTGYAFPMSDRSLVTIQVISVAPATEPNPFFLYEFHVSYSLN